MISMVISTHEVLSCCHSFVCIINKNSRIFYWHYLISIFIILSQKKNFFLLYHFRAPWTVRSNCVLFLPFFIEKGHGTVTSSFFVLSYTAFYTTKQQIKNLLFTWSSMHLLRIRVVSECVRHHVFEWYFY